MFFQSGVRRLHKQTVVVHLLSGQSLRGVLRDTFADSILLSRVHHLDEDTELKGDLLVPLGRIDYYQRGT